MIYKQLFLFSSLGFSCLYLFNSLEDLCLAFNSSVIATHVNPSHDVDASNSLE
ncbi:hypothetical protein Bca101_014034 [Brassica carinata]